MKASSRNLREMKTSFRNLREILTILQKSKPRKALEKIKKVLWSVSKQKELIEKEKILQRPLNKPK